MSETTLLWMSPSDRVKRIEATRARIRNLMREHGHRPSREDKQLSTATAAWLEHLTIALVDVDCSDESYEEIEQAAFQAVPLEEADELRRRLRSFWLAEVFPLHARSVDESVEPVIEAFVRIADTHKKKVAE